MLGFWHKYTDRSKPIIKIKMMIPYHSVQMNTQPLNLTSMYVLRVDRYIKIEFDVEYFQ